MNHPHECTQQMDRAAKAVASDDPEKARQLHEDFGHPAKNAVACAVYAGDQPPLNRLKPQTTVYPEADAIETEPADTAETEPADTAETEPADTAETEPDAIETFKTKRHISRYKPGEVETAVVRNELNLVDIETPEIDEEAAVFIGDLNASAAYAVHIAPATIQLAPTFDAFVVVKNSQFTDTELETLRESLGRFRELRDGKLPLFYLHHSADESAEAATAQYQSNVEKLQLLPDGVEAFQCENLDTSDPDFESFRRSWGTVVDNERDTFVSGIWGNFLLKIKEIKEEYERFVERTNGYTDFQENVEKYQQIADEHPNEFFARAWEDVNHLSRYRVSMAFSGNNGQETLYDIAMQDIPDSGDSAVWDEWCLVKSSEILKAFLAFIMEVEQNFFQEYVRVHGEEIEQVLQQLSDAGITTEKYPALKNEIRASVDSTLKLRELFPNLTSEVEAWFRYGFMMYLLSSVTLSTVSWIASLIVAGKAGAEASQVASPLGPVASIAAFAIGALIGAIIAKKMVTAQNSKAYRAEASQQLSRLLASLQTEAFTARDQLWMAYKRELEDQRKALHTAVRTKMTEESQAYQDMKEATPEEIAQKLAVIQTLDDILAASEEPASENEDDNSGRD